MKNGQTLPESARGQSALIKGLAEKGMCGLVIGLEMQRRLDPDAISDELAVAGLRTLVDAFARTRERA